MRPRIAGHPKPVIGLAGGIGSGKSFVAGLFEQCGCGVINSDRLAHDVMERPAVLTTLREWWGGEVILPDGHPDRKAISRRVFGDPLETQRLNGLIHPEVAKLRGEANHLLFADQNILAVVWDTPLLYETRLEAQCDAVVFVKTLYEKRLDRVRRTRGWTAEELARRENFQMALDKKQELADYCVDNTGEASTSLSQVRQVLDHIRTNFNLPA